jgi:hypothetical protein
MRAKRDCWIVRYMLLGSPDLSGFSLLDDAVLPDGPAARGGPLRGVCTGLGDAGRLGASLCSARELLGEFGGELFDFYEEGFVVVHADAMDEEDEAACSSDGDEHPGVDGEAEDCSLGDGGSMIGERGLDS